MNFAAMNASRVAEHTPAKMNDRIQQKLHANIAYYRDHPEQIQARMKELNSEWDIERSLEVNSSALTLTGLLLGATVSRKWLILPIAVQTFFLQHAIQGWCPPLPVMRSLGIRTVQEIESERHALQVILREHSKSDGAPANQAAAMI